MSSWKKRKSVRVPITEPVLLVDGESQFPAVTVNVSAGGILAKFDSTFGIDIEIGSTVQMDMDGWVMPARVVSVVPCECGSCNVGLEWIKA